MVARVLTNRSIQDAARSEGCLHVLLASSRAEPLSDTSGPGWTWRRMTGHGDGTADPGTGAWSDRTVFGGASADQGKG